MSLIKARYILLSVWIVACASTMSCRSVGSESTDDKKLANDPKKQVEKRDNRVLSEQEIIKAANRAARRRGLGLARYDVFYDEGNAGWKYFVTRLSRPAFESKNGPVWSEGAFERNLRSHWPELESHDYQAVYYVFRPPDKGIYGRTWILVDRNTGEVLLTWEQAG